MSLKGGNVRIRLFAVLLFAVAFSVHAHSANLDGIEPIADGHARPGKTRSISDLDTAGDAITPATNFRRIEITATVPDPDAELADPFSPARFKIPNTQLKLLRWNEINGWRGDDHAAAFETFLKSCKTIVNGASPHHASQTFYLALQSVCRRAIKELPLDRIAARIFFERNFRPMRIAPLGQNNGFLTGYYEPIIEGSHERNTEFNVPLYRTPPHLTKSYLDRAAIEDGALAGRNLEICWLKDPTDLFFAQIQGSARVRLEDGKILRLNYSSHNGWPYTAIGGILIAREIVPKEEMSMDRIREWIEANPKEGKELRRRNKSFVFFRETGLAEHEEPVGAQGVSLTPGRSIAVDKSIHIYGTPFFIEADLPLDGERSENSLRRLWVAQDTGGAIRGPARADLYFGAGDAQAEVAGRIRHPGQFTILIPREIDSVIAGRSTPLPRSRPGFTPGQQKLEIASEQPASDQKKEANTGRKVEQQ
jgi:membrane-bound lytic murein transglycosylase A